MIRLTRLNGSVFSLNPDLIHRAEETPDTVLTLIDGSRYVVVEPLDELITRVVDYRARVVAQAGIQADQALAGPQDQHGGQHDGDGGDHEDRYDQHGERDRRTGASVVRLRTRRA